MSVSATRPTSPVKARATSRPPARWVPRLAAACLLVLASGFVRQIQVDRVRKYMDEGRVAPFKLAAVPMQLGSWTGKGVELDPAIVKGTGSNDLITRRYTDSQTGVSLDVIVLYGPTTDIFIHSPELCYPKAGYVIARDPLDRTIATAAGDVPFRAIVYTKGDPGRPEVQEVYYSWRHSGRWSSLPTSPKESERIPGMYKIQIARPASPNEARTTNNPCESFLEKLIPDLEARINGQSPPSPEATRTHP